MTFAARNLAACFLAVLCACTAQTASNAVPAGRAATVARSATLVLRIKVPRKHRSRYISPATRAMTLQITGPTTIPKEVVGLTPSSPGCSGNVCTVKIGLAPCPTAKTCYAATIETYDAYDAGTNTIPVGANELSAAQIVPFTIAKTIENRITVVLDGIPASIAFIPSPSSALRGNQVAGFTFPKTVACAGTAQTVQVLSADADGNYILGAGAPVVSVASENSAQLAVSTAPSSAPNTFTLSPPAAPSYAFGNFKIVLDVTATPGSASGTRPFKSSVTVAYGGEICGQVNEFPVPTASSLPFELAGGLDGNVWFTEAHGDKVARITPAGAITEFTLTSGSHPIGIALGPDKNLWFTESVSRIGTISTSGVIHEYSTSASRYPHDIVAGPDGNLWFTEPAGAQGYLGVMSTSGTLLQEYPVTSTEAPIAITVGPDKNLWYSEPFGAIVSSMTTAGSVTDYTVPVFPIGMPYGIVAGPDHASLWYSDPGNQNLIAQISTAGVAGVQIAIPTSFSQTYYLTVGPDGGLWFAEFYGSKIGTVSAKGPGGAVTEYSITAASMPYYIGVGPDGALWFTEQATDKIGRLR
jgi:streptogramin lyase